MYDATILYRDLARERYSLDAWHLTEGGYTGDPSRFGQIREALARRLFAPVRGSKK